MNNQLKKISKKKIYITSFVIVLSVIAILAFSLKRERANTLLDDKQIEQNLKFSYYEEYKGNIIKLYTKDDKSTFYNLENKEIHSTNYAVDYFKVVDEDSIVFISSYLNLSINEFISDIVYVDLKTGKEEVLATGEQLYVETSEGLIYIVNGKNGEVLSGKYNALEKSSLKTPISKVVSSRDKIFAINHTVINDIVRSTIYCLTDTTVEATICPGKVQSVSVDYSNDNIIYYSSLNLNQSIHTGYSNDVVVFKKYLIDLSAYSTEPQSINTLNSNVISIKDKYITIDKEDNCLYLLTTKYTKLKKIGSLNENSFNSLVKVSTDGENLYFIDKNGQLKKL